MNSGVIIGIVVFVVILIILINSTDTPYSIDDHHNDIMKNYDEKKWLEYQESETFKKQELYDRR